MNARCDGPVTARQSVSGGAACPPASAHQPVRGSRPERSDALYRILTYLPCTQHAPITIIQGAPSTCPAHSLHRAPTLHTACSEHLLCTQPAPSTCPAHSLHRAPILHTACSEHLPCTQPAPSTYSAHNPHRLDAVYRSSVRSGSWKWWTGVADVIDVAISHSQIKRLLKLKDTVEVGLGKLRLRL